MSGTDIKKEANRQLLENFRKLEKYKMEKDMEYHNKLDTYLRSLFFILDKNSECFIKGSYIINDPNNQLLEILDYLRYNSNLISKFIKRSTHNKYLPNGKYLNEIVLYKPIINDNCHHCINDICHDCKYIAYYNIKYYSITKSNNKDINYIYLKLETAPTFTINHAINKSNLMRKELYLKLSKKLSKKKISPEESSEESQLESSNSTCPKYREDCDRYDECRSRIQYPQKNEDYKLNCKDKPADHDKIVKEFSDLKEFENINHIEITNSNKYNKLNDCGQIDKQCKSNKVSTTSNVFFVSKEINDFIFKNCINSISYKGGKLSRYNKTRIVKKTKPYNKTRILKKTKPCNKPRILKKTKSHNKSRILKKIKLYNKTRVFKKIY